MPQKGTQPGEFQAARKRHLNRQKNSDALRKLRNGESADVLVFTEKGFKLMNVLPVECVDGVLQWKDFGEFYGLVRFGNRLCCCLLYGDNQRGLMADPCAYMSSLGRYIKFEEILGWIPKTTNL